MARKTIRESIKPDKLTNSASFKKPLWFLVRSLKYGKFRKVTALKPKPENCAKRTETDTSNRNKPISACDKTFGKSKAVVTNPKTTPK